MRVNMTQVPGQGDMKVRTRTGAFTDSLKEGDLVKAQVVSSEKGAVVMKAENGQVFKARMEAETTLLPGDEIQLEVSGKEKGTVSLSIIAVNGNSEETSGQTGAGKEISDKNLAPYADKLAELKMPVTEGAARLMRELMAQNPGMTLEEAAFLISNKLTGNDNLIKAALALLSGGEKTDALIARLLEFLNLPEIAEPGGPGGMESGVRQPELIMNAGQLTQDILSEAPFQITARETAGGPSPIDPESGNVGQVVSDAQTAASSLILDLESTSGPLSPDPEPGNVENMVQNPGVTAPSQIMNPESASGSPPISPEIQGPISELTSAPLTDWLGLIGSDAAGFLEAPGQGIQTLIEGISQIIPHSDTVLQSTNVENVENTVELAQNGIQAGDRMGSEQQTTTVSKPESGAGNIASMGRAIAEVLSEIPEFRGTPAPALERFSNMLLRVADDNSDEPQNSAGKIAALLDKLFTRIEKNDKDGGQRLRNAREELFTRLTMIEEEIIRAAPPAKAEMLDQTRRLMEHVRLLNNIDQFIYIQLPVKLGEERKAAELYLFKKKGGKRTDPENVNILLALDLENMGHWEALINFRNKDVSIQMEVPGEAEKLHFSENTVLLHEMLAEAGFKLVNTEIKYSKKETTPLTALVSFDRYTGRSGAIDYVV